MYKQTEGVLARVSQQLSQLEKRDGELWLIVSRRTSRHSLLCGLSQARQHSLRNTGIAALVLGLVALLALLNAYLLTRRLEIRRVRESCPNHSAGTGAAAITDPLTEIYSRYFLEDMAGRFMSQARGSKKPLTLLLIDVDHFKVVNTRFGHLTGAGMSSW